MAVHSSASPHAWSVRPREGSHTTTSGPYFRRPDPIAEDRRHRASFVSSSAPSLTSMTAPHRYPGFDRAMEAITGARVSLREAALGSSHRDSAIAARRARTAIEGMTRYLEEHPNLPLGMRRQAQLGIDALRSSVTSPNPDITFSVAEAEPPANALGGN